MSENKYSQTSIYVHFYLRTSALRTIFHFFTYYSEYVLKFYILTLLNVLKFDTRTFPQYAYWITEYVKRSTKAP